MAGPALTEIQQDSLALSVAGALAIANETASTHGIDPDASIVPIAEESPPPNRLWRVHYGPRDFKRRRGGDLVVIVNEQSGIVDRVVHGQ